MSIDPQNKTNGEEDQNIGYRKNWNPYHHYRNEEVAQAYDDSRFTSLEGRVFCQLEARCLRGAFSSLPPNSLILDAPCGTGRLAKYLLGLGHRVVGMDISGAMLAVVRKKLAQFGDRFTTEVKDVRELGQDSNQFDAVLCARILMHIPLPEQVVFLRSVAQTTNGLVVINQSMDTRFHRMRRGLKAMMGHQASAAYPISYDQVKQLMDGAGLRIERSLSVFTMVSEAKFFQCYRT